MDRIIAAKTVDRAPTADALDVLFDFLIEEGGSIGTIYAHHTEEDMNLALSQPWCSIGSDGLALNIEGPLRQRSSPSAKLRDRSHGSWANMSAIDACCGWRTPFGR